MTHYYTKPVSPLPWRKDELNNVYDATGMLIFTPRAHNDAVGVMPENDGNSDLIVRMSEFMHEEELISRGEL
jgi:hypothetical protein